MEHEEPTKKETEDLLLSSVKEQVQKRLNTFSPDQMLQLLKLLLEQ